MASDDTDLGTTGLVTRTLALGAATAVFVTFVGGVAAPLAQAATVDPADALQPKNPFPALAQCRGSAPVVVPVPTEAPEPSATPSARPSASASSTASPSAKPTPSRPFALRINSGGAAVNDGGVAWVADRYFVGGTTGRVATPVSSSTPKVDADERTGLRGYRIPVAVDGTYRVRLHLTELSQPGPGYRLLTITIEGRQVAQGVDVFAVAGGKNITKVLEFTVAVTDGTLNLDMAVTAGAKHPDASLTGLEVLGKS